MNVKVTLTFEEAAFGAQKEVSVSRIEPCKECKGTGAKTEPNILSVLTAAERVE